MKIVVITDVHGNLPALRAALEIIKQDGFDLLIHTGDAIAIGPFPAECLDLLFSIRNARFVMGNHDELFAYGLPQSKPAWMSNGEFDHQKWTHSQIDPIFRAEVAKWPYRIHFDFGGVPTSFVHYPLDASGKKFVPFVMEPAAADLDQAFSLYAPNASLNFYGHNHCFSDLEGQARYVNPGSLGCATTPIARYTLAEFQGGGYRVEHRSVAYDDRELFNAYEQRCVPERKFIYNAFLGGRFPGFDAV
jgi:predicted phosphodiesterase